MFFFEKKNQKTFARWRASRLQTRVAGSKRFLALFCKKEVLACLACFLLCAADSPPPPAHTERVPPERASGILGADVQGADGQALGKIIDVLVDDTGKPRAAVIDFGGFLGMGSRKIAVSWTDLHFSPDAKLGMLIKLDLTADQIKAAPAYEEASPAAVVGTKTK